MENIVNLVITACRNARKISDVDEQVAITHKNRSINFVECLAQLLHNQYEAIENIATLSKHNPENRAKFGVNELLFDITTCQFSTINSGKSNKELAYITKGLWVVESEMAKDKRQALYDFNKIVLADSENKLFVGPLVHHSEEADYLNVLAAAATYCKGNLYLALVPHPGNWGSENNIAPEATKAFYWKDGWQLISE